MKAYESDLAAIDRLLDGKKLGAIPPDPWMAASLMADLGPGRVRFLHPDKPRQLEECRAILLHSAWPDEGPWTGELLPAWGERAQRFLAARHGQLADLYEGLKIPLIYWDLEGNNPGTRHMFDHFAFEADVIARVCGTKQMNSFRQDGLRVAWLSGREPHGRSWSFAPMAASVALHYLPGRAQFSNRYIIFPGRWYKEHNERCRFLYDVLDELEQLHEEDSFIITAWGGREQWPERFWPHLVPPMAFPELADKYRDCRLGINHNLWSGAVSMRRPCMAMSGLPIVERVEDLRPLLEDEQAWNAAAENERSLAYRDHRLTSRIVEFLQLALDGG